ncbi:MAG TPA: hypothetical protein VFW77_01225 [Candidatus Saccharimonadales bacterium]|nr:hypothetical protein [Candidatus Saccharimonadales bacterium]
MSDVAVAELTGNVGPFPEPPLRSCRGYKGSRALFHAAADQFGVELTDEESYDWAVVLGGSMLLDHLVDVEQVDITGPFQEITSGHFRDDLSRDIQVRFANFMHRQDEQGRQALLDGVKSVDELARSQRNAETVQEIIDIRREEADLLASFLKLPTDGLLDASARKEFNRWVNSWSRVGYMMDSLFDIKQDYENGEVGLRPTLSDRIKLAKAAAEESVVAIKRTPPSLFGKCVLNGMRYVVFNMKLPVTEE